jgi:hypothetical protein
MKLVNGVGIVVAAVAATLMASARAEASSFSVNVCPGGSGCATGVTEASLSFEDHRNGRYERLPADRHLHG